jgi:transcriptional regulator with XRE-family HTH domain
MLNISEKLKQARLASNLTQEELADRVGVSRQTISNWENGRSYPDIVSIIELSNIYNMTLDSLLKGDNEMIEHLKKSTDVTKSNRHVLIALALFGAMVLIGFLTRDFASTNNMGGLITKIIASIGMIAAAFAVSIRLIDRIKRTELKTSNKVLLKTGTVVITVLLYGLLAFFLWT